MEGEEVSFGYFYLIWKDYSFAYLPKRMGSKSSSSLSKIIFVDKVNFRVFENSFEKRGRGLKAREKNKMRLVKF